MGDASRHHRLELCQLPAECLSTIFSRLDTTRDIGTATRVCRQWRFLVPASISRLFLSHKLGLSQDTLLRVLASYPALTDLRLPHLFSSDVYEILLQGIARSCPRLTALDASGFRLQDFAFSSGSITSLLDACPGLHRLKLGTRVSSEMAPAPALWLSPAPPRPHLRCLTLERCSLPSPRDIPLSHLSQLQELSLRQCLFPERASRVESVGDISALFTLVGQLPGLRKLELWLLDNFQARLTEEDGDGECLWLRKLGSLHSLQSLTLCGLWQTNSLPVSWACCLPALRSLRLLRLTHFRNLASVFALTGLTTLAISHCEVEQLPPQISQLSRLSALAYTHSHLLREVPTSLTRLSSLTQLDLTANARLRSLPHSAGALTGLQTLCLSGCRALGSLPSWLDSLAQLKLLDISECSTGLQVPAALAGQRHVRVADQSAPPLAPSLWCPLDPSLQLHPAVRRARGRSHAAVDEDALLVGLGGRWGEDEEEEDYGHRYGELWELDHVGFEDDFEDGSVDEYDFAEMVGRDDGGIEVGPGINLVDEIVEIDGHFVHLGPDDGPLGEAEGDFVDDHNEELQAEVEAAEAEALALDAMMLHETAEEMDEHGDHYSGWDGGAEDADWEDGGVPGEDASWGGGATAHEWEEDCIEQHASYEFDNVEAADLPGMAAGGEVEELAGLGGVAGDDGYDVYEEYDDDGGEEYYDDSAEIGGWGFDG